MRMKNTSKRLLLGASAVIALTLAGCSTVGDNGVDGDNGDSTEQVQQVQPLHIAKPTIAQVEDDVVDTAELQANLDAINEGERLPDYEPVNEDERVLDVQDNQEFNDSVYTLKDPKDLKEGTHFVYVGRVTCPYCTMLRVNLDPVVEQLNLGLGYVDTDNDEYNAYMVEEFGLVSVPQIVVFHEGEVVAQFPQTNMYLEAGVNYQSLANGLGDLANIYLGFKHGFTIEDIDEEGNVIEQVEETTEEETTEEESVEETDESVEETDSEE